jgi:hypothetical protein
MVYFHTKNTNLDIFWWALGRKMLVPTYILWPFGTCYSYFFTFYVHLGILVIRYTYFPHILVNYN